MGDRSEDSSGDHRATVGGVPTVDDQGGDTSSGQLPAHSESQLQASPACRDSLGPLVLSQPSLSQSVLHQPPSAPRPPAQPHRSVRQPHTDLSVEAPSERTLYYVYSQSIIH